MRSYAGGPYPPLKADHPLVAGYPGGHVVRCCDCSTRFVAGDVVVLVQIEGQGHDRNVECLPAHEVCPL